MSKGEVIRLDAANEELKLQFMRWQCHLRQMIMREREGKPDNAILPSVTLVGENEPIGHIITLICKRPEYSRVPELKQMFRATHDPAIKRAKALTLFSETYYQRAAEFSDVLTSTFLPGSDGAGKIRRAGACLLEFDAFGQRYTLQCKVWRLSEHNPLWQATYWHNLLFNPSLPGDTIVIGFEPDWSRSHADPMPGQRQRRADGRKQ